MYIPDFLKKYFCSSHALGVGIACSNLSKASGARFGCRPTSKILDINFAMICAPPSIKEK